MTWKRIFLVLGAMAAMASSKPSFAEGYYGGDPWAGLYGTGGYNLYDFGQSLYDTSSYLYSNYGSSYDLYGGGCGSFYGSCSSPYSSAGLYGSDWGMTPYLYGSSNGCGSLLGSCGSSYGGYGGLTIDININLISSLLSSMPSYNSYDPYGYGSYNNCDIGCSLGYCSGSSYPYGGSSYYNQLFGQYNYGIPGYNTIDVNLYNPWQNYQPPTYTPPYGGCGGVVPCPQGPITRVDPPVFQPPTYNPMPTYPPFTTPPRVVPPTYLPPTFDPGTHTGPTYSPPPRTTPPTFQPPTYQPPTFQSPTQQFVPTPPNRYRVPRGS